MPTVTKRVTIRAYPNGAQVRFLNQWFGASRWLWNFSLELRKKAYFRRKESVNSIAVSRLLTKLKRTSRYQWLSIPPATVLTQVLRDQDVAFRNFFRGLKTNNSVGFPRFRSRSIRASLRFQDVSSTKWATGIVSLPKLGRMKLAENLPTMPCPDSVTLYRDAAGRHFVSFVAQQEIALLPTTNRMIGVDLGITTLATLSSGEKIENPRKYRNRLVYLRQQSRALSRKVKGSNRRNKQRHRLARAHAKVAQQRSYAAHQLTTKLVREYDVICIEDLKPKNMMKHPRLAKHIADAGFGEIRRQLEYKTQWYGRTLIVADQWYPSSKTCSHCGHKLDELQLNVREWTCPKCQTRHDRDVNAAQNLLTVGIRQLDPREAGDLRVEEQGSDYLGSETGSSEARTGQIN